MSSINYEAILLFLLIDSQMNSNGDRNLGLCLEYIFSTLKPTDKLELNRIYAELPYSHWA